MVANLVSDETSPLVADSACLPCPHMVQRERKLSGVPSHEDGNPCGPGPFLTSFNLNYFLRGPILKHATLGVMASHIHFFGGVGW